MTRRASAATWPGLAPAAEEALLRSFVFVGNLVTGVFTGAVIGAIGWLVAKAVPGLRPR